MKNNIIWLLIFVFFTNVQTYVWGDEPSANRLRLMSYNIHNGIGLDNQTDYVRIAHVINQCRPDVVAIQELDSATHRSRQAVVLEQLALHTDMHPTFSAAISYDGGKYGIGILSKEKPLRTHRVALPGREEARTLLIVEFADYVFACTHLSLTEEDRMASLDLLKQEVLQSDKPFFLAGDWNAHPDEPFIQHLKSDFTLLTDVKKFTYPADSLKGTIDYIAIASKDSSSCKLLLQEVVDESVASDHRPVLCEVELQKGK